MSAILSSSQNKVTVFLHRLTLLMLSYHDDGRPHDLTSLASWTRVKLVSTPQFICRTTNAQYKADIQLDKVLGVESE